MILAGDVGGTKVNLGLYEVRNEKLALLREGTHPSREFNRFQDLVRVFLGRDSSQSIDSACFGIAGPVRHGRVQATNLPWMLEEQELKRELGLRSVSLINDLEANGYGLAELPPSDFSPLNPSGISSTGNAAIISPGTGLGEAGLYWDGLRRHPFACEGGHADFAPQSELDAELFNWLRDRFGHASWERVLSGAGLENIHRFLTEKGIGDESPQLTETISKGAGAPSISEAALNGTSSRCARALDMFATYLGAEAGNLALKMMATGGVFIGGGIAPRILPWLQKDLFLRAFFAKGKMSSLLQSIRVQVVLNPKAALLGAAHFAAFRGSAIQTPE